MSTRYRKLLTCKAPCPECWEPMEKPINCPDMVCYQCQARKCQQRAPKECDDVVERDIVADVEAILKADREFRKELDEACRSLDEQPMQSFSTGAVRDTDTGKTRWSLLPWRELERVVRETYMPGAKHYGDHNWTKGIPSSRCLESLQRHVLAFSMGDVSEDHLGRAVFNCLAIMYNQRVFKDNSEINDLPGWEPDAT